MHAGTTSKLPMSGSGVISDVALGNRPSLPSCNSHGGFNCIMSCEGPIVSVHPSPAPSPGHVHMHSGLMSSGTPPPRRVYNKSLLNAAGRDRAQSIGLQPDAFLTPLSASHPSSQGGGGLSVLRSRSLPRGAHVEDSAELSLPVGGVSHPRSPAAGSGRFMRRAETIDTDKIQKEEFEVCVYKLDCL